MKKKKQKPKTEKQIKKEKEKLVKDFRTTYEWLELEGISGNFIVINDKLCVCGIKITPPKIKGGDRERAMWVNRLNKVYNQTDLEIYHQQILSPIYVDNHIAELSNYIEDSEDAFERNQLIYDSIDAYRFIATHYPKTEYFLLVKGNPNNEKFMKRFDDLYQSLKANRFDVSLCNVIDFENYFSYIFENDLVNDFFFSRGIYSILEDDKKNEMEGVK